MTHKPDSGSQTPECDPQAPERKGPLFMSDEQAHEKLVTGEAWRSAKRLIDHYFRNDGESVRASIPARPDYDDDLIVTDCLRFAATQAAQIATLTAEVERLKVLCHVLSKPQPISSDVQDVADAVAAWINQRDGDDTAEQIAISAIEAYKRAEGRKGEAE